MENASKALLIAGGVLIAILVASLGVYFSRTMADDVAEFYKKLEESKRTEFNQQFLNFNESIKQEENGTWVDTTINIQDIVTIINLAKNTNRLNDFGDADDPNNPLVTPPNNPLDDNSLYITVKSIYDDGSGKGIGNFPKDKCEHLEQFKNDEINQAINYEMSKSNPPKYKCIVRINKNTGYVNYIEISN